MVNDQVATEDKNNIVHAFDYSNHEEIYFVNVKDL